MPDAAVFHAMKSNAHFKALFVRKLTLFASAPSRKLLIESSSRDKWSHGLTSCQAWGFCLDLFSSFRQVAGGVLQASSASLSQALEPQM